MMGLPVRRLVLATNENNVLDEFFRTGRYRARSAAEVHQTSSPSMDISKASNFERFVFDALGRDASRTRELIARIERSRAVHASTPPSAARIAELRLRVGPQHATPTGWRRSATSIDASARSIDTHTADGLKVGARASRVAACR